MDREQVEQFARELLARRKSAGLSRKALAEKSGVATALVDKLENPRKRSPLHDLAALIAVLGRKLHVALIEPDGTDAAEPHNADEEFFYVDEAGDPLLFGRRGRVVVGDSGVSKYFMLGCLHVPDPVRLGKRMNDLRAALVSDPYFAGLASCAPGAKKTAALLHAKDDHSDVRHEVYRCLRAEPGLQFTACVIDKLTLVDDVKRRAAQDPSYHYSEDHAYDTIAGRLLRDHLHKKRSRLLFAKRGKSDRTRALQTALSAARQSFCQTRGIDAVEVPFSVECRESHVEPCLQAADYFMWAVQRCFERSEDRFVRALGESISMVIDADDVREKPYGRYYSSETPLTAAVLAGRRRR